MRTSCDDPAGDRPEEGHSSPEDRMRVWLTADVPNAAELRGRIRALLAHRQEVIEWVAEEMGANRIVLDLDRQIQERLNQLQACGIRQEEDGLLEDLLWLRKAAVKQMLWIVSDHPTVRWIMDVYSSQMEEIKRKALSA